MKTIVAVIDAGGRGAALVDAYGKSPQVDEIIVIPGNDLMKINSTKPVRTFPDLRTTSKEEILKICKENQVSLVDVAQDNSVEAGVADLLRENGFKTTGPSRAAGRIEWDKAFSRGFMVKQGLPAPRFQVCHSKDEGIEFLRGQKEQAWFIKASGLAEGKGVIPARNNMEAEVAIEEMGRFGASGQTFLIEQALVGEEFSAFVVSDGESFQFLGAAQDHKRALDRDQGPNTGGMGCSTPPLVITENIKLQILNIFEKTFEGLKEEGLLYQGVLYLGGMVVKEGPEEKVYIIEYNARWGDPEVECILPGLRNDLYQVGLAVADKKLNSLRIENDEKYRVVVAACSRGYPEDYSQVKGKEILGLDKIIGQPGIKVYGAGVKTRGDKFIASGGRLFYVVAEGQNVIEARQKANEALEKVSIPEGNDNLLHYRKDIGFRDVERLSAS